MTRTAESPGVEGELSAGREHLAQAVHALASTPPEPDELDHLAGLVRQIQRDCSAALVGIAQLAETYSMQGLCGPAELVLRCRDQVSEQTARADVVRARVAKGFPEVGRSVQAGTARPENIDVLARLTDKMNDSEVAALRSHDKAIADAAARLGVDSFRKRVQRLRDRIRGDHGLTAAQQAAAETMARVSVSRDNRTYRLTAVLTALQGEAIRQALRREHRHLSESMEPGHGMTSEQLSAQALTDVVTRGANTERTEHNNRPIIHLSVVTDGTTLSSGPHSNTIAETGDGMPVTPGLVGQIACDCVIQRVATLPDGEVHVSRSSRTATPAQRAALRALYPVCPISGAPWSQIEVHHVKFVEHGGETALPNLFPLARRWHHLIHDEGWRLELDTDRTARLSRPDGTLFRTIPPPTSVLLQQDNDLAA